MGHQTQTSNLFSQQCWIYSTIPNPTRHSLGDLAFLQLAWKSLASEPLEIWNSPVAQDGKKKRHPLTIQTKKYHIHSTIILQAFLQSTRSHIFGFVFCSSDGTERERVGGFLNISRTCGKKDRQKNRASSGLDFHVKSFCIRFQNRRYKSYSYEPK